MTRHLPRLFLGALASALSSASARLHRVAGTPSVVEEMRRERDQTLAEVSTLRDRCESYAEDTRSLDECLERQWARAHRLLVGARRACFRLRDERDSSRSILAARDAELAEVKSELADVRAAYQHVAASHARCKAVRVVRRERPPLVLEDDVPAPPTPPTDEQRREIVEEAAQWGSEVGASALAVERR